MTKRMIDTRRKLLKALAVAAAGPGAGVARADPSSLQERCPKRSGDPYTDKECLDSWIQNHMAIPHSSTKPLLLGRFVDRIYFLLEEVNWTTDSKYKSSTSVNVPRGFVTDFASVPRIFWSILPPDGDYVYPAIIHDYLYWDQPAGVTREEADLVMLDAMNVFNVGSVKSHLIHKAVRLGGESAWKGNAELKKTGERRILRNFPSNPVVQWKDWKKRPGNF